MVRRQTLLDLLPLLGQELTEDSTSGSFRSIPCPLEAFLDSFSCSVSFLSAAVLLLCAAVREKDRWITVVLRLHCFVLLLTRFLRLIAQLLPLAAFDITLVCLTDLQVSQRVFVSLGTVESLRGICSLRTFLAISRRDPRSLTQFTSNFVCALNSILDPTVLQDSRKRFRSSSGNLTCSRLRNESSKLTGQACCRLPRIQQRSKQFPPSIYCRLPSDTVADELFSLSPMTFDEQSCAMRCSLSLMRTSRVSLFSHIFLPSASGSTQNKVPSAASQHVRINPSKRRPHQICQDHLHSVPFHSFAPFRI